MSKGGSKPAPPPTQTTTTQITEFPPELRPYISDVLTRAQAQQNRREREGYQAYEGPRIAARTEDQEASQQAARDIVAGGVSSDPTLRAASTYYNPALGLTLGQAERFGVEQAQQYMSPYQQAVIDVEKREAIRNFQPQFQQIKDQAVAAGGFGGSRRAILEAEANRNLQQQLGDIQTRGSQQAYDRGLSAFEAQKARERGAASGLAALGSAVPQQAFKEASVLESIGAGNRADSQRALDLAYQQFQDEQLYPTRNLQEYQSIIRGFPYTPSAYSASQTYTPPPTFLQNALGIGTGLAGLQGAYGGQGGYFKEGGSLRKLLNGGEVLPRPKKNRLAGSNRAYNERIEREQTEWDSLYGTTHNRDGSPKTIDGETPSSVPSTRSQSEEQVLLNNILKNVHGIDEGEDLTMPMESRDESEAANKILENLTGSGPVPVPTPKPVTPSRDIPDPELVGLAATLASQGGSSGNLGDLEGRLSDLLSTVESRPTVTPETTALKDRYSQLVDELPQRRRRREDELRRQRYLQLAEFGRNLLGADTTKGLLAQVAEAGEKPLQNLAALSGEQARIEDDLIAEELGILGKQAELAQTEQSAERQKISDIVAISGSLAEIAEARSDLKNLAIDPPSASIIAQAIETSKIAPYAESEEVRAAIGDALSKAMTDLRTAVESGTVPSDEAGRSLFFFDKFREKLNAIDVDGLTSVPTESSAAAAIPNSGAQTTSNVLDSAEGLM